MSAADPSMRTVRTLAEIAFVARRQPCRESKFGGDPVHTTASFNDLLVLQQAIGFLLRNAPAPRHASERL